jgi:hypothetical protein
MSYRRQFKYSKLNPVGFSKPPFAAFNSHTKDSPVMRNENMIITSIDPGIVNCGIYVNCINTKSGKQTSLFLGKLEFNDGENHYITSINKLDKLEEEQKFFSSSHYIVIESQMAVSYDNTRMAQHLITYFSTKLKDIGNRPIIIEFNSQSKTRLLDCPKGMKKHHYKKWCKDKAIEILKSRDSKSEDKFIKILEITKKADDMGDSICQCHAWKMVMDGEAVKVPKPVLRNS